MVFMGEILPFRRLAFQFATNLTLAVDHVPSATISFAPLRQRISVDLLTPDPADGRPHFKEKGASAGSGPYLRASCVAFYDKRL
jgi:hypothetical protein